MQRFAEFDAAAGERKEAVGRRARPAHDQQAAVAEYGGAHRQIRPRRISSRFAAGTRQRPIPFGYDRKRRTTVIRLPDWFIPMCGRYVRDSTIRPRSLSFTNILVNHDFTGII